MPGSTDVVVKFLADVSDMQKGVASIDKTVGGVKKGFQGVAAGIGGVFAVKTVSDWVSAAEEADSVSAGLAQTLGNAGDATGQWAKHAEDLASSLQYKTGIDDEVIKKGQTILGTFHDLSGATGQQSGAFDRATKAALDLSKAGFGDVDSAATMLGKALEDPERGLTALRRVGINFTADQENLIKSLVASGDKAGAMNEVLKVVEGQVGGVAEKTATSGDKMRVAWGETQESLGKALLPVLEKLAPILENIAKFVQQNADWLVPLVMAIGGLVLALKAWAFIQGVVNILMSANPIGLIILGIAALTAAVILLWKNWDTIWGWITAAFSWVSDLIYGLMSNKIIQIFFPLIWVLKLLWDNWSTIWGWITTALSWAWDNVLHPIFDAFIWLFTLIGNTVSWVWDNVIRPAWDALSVAWSWLWDHVLKPGFESAKIMWGQMADAMKWVWDNILKPVWDAMEKAWSWLWDHVLKPGFEATKKMWGEIGDAIKWVWEHVIKPVWDDIKRVIDDMKVIVKAGKENPTVLSSIPGLAAGGIVTRPTLAMIGEAGPEAVVPLDGHQPVAGGPLINIEHVTLASEVDVDVFASRMAWILQRERV